MTTESVIVFKPILAVFALRTGRPKQRRDCENTIDICENN